MTKFTPGPWRLKTDGNMGNTIEAQTNRRSHEFDKGWRSVATFQSACESDFYADQEENGRANGELIAAAPELYEALDKLLHEILEAGFASASDYGWPKVIPAARAALAKARGEEP